MLLVVPRSTKNLMCFQAGLGLTTALLDEMMVGYDKCTYWWYDGRPSSESLHSPPWAFFALSWSCNLIRRHETIAIESKIYCTIKLSMDIIWLGLVKFLLEVGNEFSEFLQCRGTAGEIMYNAILVDHLLNEN